MNRNLVALLYTVTLSASAAADYCNGPWHGPSADRLSIQQYPPAAKVAPAVLRTDLSEGQTTTEPIAALRVFERSRFHLQRPDIPGPPGSVSQRCAPMSMYKELDAATQSVVLKLRQAYIDNRWFLGDANWQHRTTNRPGLLNLLLHAHLYDVFEQDAAAFLRSAKDDPIAAKLFTQTLTAIELNTYPLVVYQERAVPEAAGLTPAEQEGVRRADAMKRRVNALRQEHVAHWLALEKPRFAALLKELNTNEAQKTALMKLDFQTPVALAALEQARDIALPTDRAALFALGTQRAETLEEHGHLRSAAQYYEYARLEDRADAISARAEAQLRTKTDKLAASLKKAAGGLQKTEQQRSDYEDGTAELASELGIDLEDF